MQLAFEVCAAKPKGERTEDAPAQEPMRGSTKQVRKNPSTDQKKERRRIQRAATTTQQMALNLSGGEYIRGPNGSTMQVHRVTPYAADPTKVLLHFTDGSAMSVDRNAPQEVVPGNQNNVQRELADDMGQVGGNFNYLPGTPQSAPSGAGRGISPGSFTQEHRCPQCGSQMQMHGNGDMACPHCGFTSMVGMAEGHTFMKDPGQAIPKPFGGQVPSRRTTMLDPYRVPAIARRARQVLALEENQ